MELGLNPDLDWDKLAQEFKQQTRIQVRDVLRPDGAERVHECLSGETPWNLVYYDGKGPVQLNPTQTSLMTPQQQVALQNKIFERAQHDYQYVYRTYPMLDAYRENRDSGLFLHKFFEFINSEEVLNFVRTLTGVSEIVKADAQATYYQGGQFLNLHTDQHTDEGWVAAHVWNFTKDWRPDWGGYLQFYDDDLNIEDAYIPRFNALNMFLVPADHAVSFVAPFAASKRLSITGWYRDH